MIVKKRHKRIYAYGRVPTENIQKLLKNLSKQVLKKKATFPVKKMATKTEVNKTNSTKNGNTRGHFLEKEKATLHQQRYQKNGDKDARGDGDFQGK